MKVQPRKRHVSWRSGGAQRSGHKAPNARIGRAPQRAGYMRSWAGRPRIYFTGTAPLAAMTDAPAELRTNSTNLETAGGGVAFVTRNESRVSV